jgi:hypothetical protein
MSEQKNKTIFEFAKDRLAPINAVFIFAGGVVVALDLLAPHGPYLQNLGIIMALPVIVMMIAELIAPEMVSSWLAQPAGALSQAIKKIWKHHCPLWMSPQFRLMIMVALVVVILGQVSKAKAETGGFFATNFETLAYAQKNILGIRTDLKEIKDLLKNVKQETSADPRKELTNLGLKWQEDDFENAVRKSDLKVLKLYVESDFIPNDLNAGSAAYYALEKGDEKVINYLVQMKMESKFASGGNHRSGCFGLLHGFEDIRPGLKFTNGKKLLKNVCGDDKEKQFLKDKLNLMEMEISNQKLIKENLQTTEQKNKFIDENINRCMSNNATKMLAGITGAREKYCKDAAQNKLIYESSAPTNNDLVVLMGYREFYRILSE